MCAYYDLNHHFCCFAFTLEIIAPFDFLRWYLLKTQEQKSILWKANGLITIYLYHMRSVIEFIIIYELCKYHEEVLKSPWGQLIVHVSSSIIFAFYLTPYWTYFITKQFFDQQAYLADAEKKSSIKKD
jgi:hypothetical protein